MRVLWLTENYPPRRGGMAQACDRIVSNLRQSGVVIDVAFFTPSSLLFKNIQQHNGRLLVIPCTDSPGHALNCLYNHLTDPAGKVTHTHVVAFGGYMPILALPIFAAWLRASAITMLRGNDFDLGIFSPQRRAMLADALNSSKAVCVLTKELQQKVSLLYPAVKPEVIANGIECKNWHCDSSDYQAARLWKQQNPASGRLTVGIIGQLKEKKGVIFFLENVLRAGLNDRFRFLLIGDIEPQVQEWLDTRQEQFVIVQMPFLDRFELLQWYPVCDFIALPSHYDGMPNVLLEAGALGIPILAARVGGINEVLPASQQLLTFHPGNADDCSETIARAVDLSDEDRHRLSTELKAYITEHFDANRETSSYVKLFNRLAKDSPG